MDTTRRSGNYESSIWDDDFVQSLTSPYKAQEYADKAEKLKRAVEELLDSACHLLDQLELIDLLQRLDISYHFGGVIQKLLVSIHANVTVLPCKENLDLYATALQFRLLRQHGYRVPQEVFCGFMDQCGNFNLSHGSDVKGLLSLYDASFLGVEGEQILDLAKDFARNHLKRRLEQCGEACVDDEIKHALEIPLHWRVQKLEARWFINVYERRADANPTLLQLAKLNYNMLQAQYQDEIKSLSRWYKETCLPEKLEFARHRLVEGFLWALGFTPEPQFAYSRKILCKIAVLITVMDDIYDLYGTLDELEALTETVQRWDINELDNLPDYLRICFLVLFNAANEMAYDIMRDQGINIVSHLRKLWAEMSRVFNVEARWYHKQYLPSFDEYLDMAWVSAPGPLVLLHTYLSVANPIGVKELERLEQYPGIIRWPSMVLRLTNDLATASGEMEKGDVASSIQCYAREKGCSEEDARVYMKQLIEVSLKRMNEEIVMEKGGKKSGVVQESFRASAMNLARIALCVYQLGDGMGRPHRETKRNLVSLIVEPIPFS